MISDQLHVKRGNNEHCSGPRTEHWRPKGYTPGARYTACAPSDDYKEQRTKIFESGPIFSEKQCPPGPILPKILLLGPKFLADQNFRDRSRIHEGQHGGVSSRSPRTGAVHALQRTAHWYHNRRRSLRQRGGGGHAWSHLRRQKDPRFLPECSPSPGRSNPPGLGPVREGMPADEHPPSPEHRPVSWLVFHARLATASPRHGATADEPSRLAGPRNGPSSPARRAQTLLPAEPKVLDSARRGERPNLPPRAIAAHHPPRLVGQKRSPELGDGG